MKEEVVEGDARKKRMKYLLKLFLSSYFLFGMVFSPYLNTSIIDNFTDLGQVLFIFFSLFFLPFTGIIATLSGVLLIIEFFRFLYERSYLEKAIN